MKDKPTKPNGTLSTDNPDFGCWQSREVYWDMVNGDVWIFEPRKLFTDEDVWLTSWGIDDWKSEGYNFKPIPSEAVKGVKPQGNTPFKWPDYWTYCAGDQGLVSASEWDEFVTVANSDAEVTTETLDPFERWIQEDLRSKKGDNVKHPSHYNQDGVESDGGPSEYYDFDPGWKTWNDFADYKAWAQWKEHSFHLGNVGKSICRWGDKGGTTKTYDARKIVYSGLRVLMMLEGKNVVQKYLDDLRENPQFKD